MTAPDYGELRDAVGAIRLAVSMLRAADAGAGSSWLANLPAAEQGRIRSVLRALDAATAELVSRVGSDATAIAAETARALARRAAPDSPAATAHGAAHATAGAPGVAPDTPPQGGATELSAALRRLEVVAAVAPAPRPLLALDVGVKASVAVPADALVHALQTAAFGLVAARPPRRQPWTVAIGATHDECPAGAPMVIIELRCELPDDAASPSASDLAAMLPGWLHECVRLTETSGGGLTRGRDGRYELVRVLLPSAVDVALGAATQVSTEPAANDAPAGPRRVA